MSEAQNAARVLNPCIFHLQKLGLELNCPLCLNLLEKPVLLPCNHIFCSFCVPNSCQFSNKCPACQHHFTNRETRPASYMENIVAIYKSLDATFNSAVFPLLSTESGTPISISTSIGQSTKKSNGVAPKGKNDHTDALLYGCVLSGIDATKCPVSEELDIKCAPEMSPGSPPSSVDDKDAGNNSNPGGRSRDTENNKVKNSVGAHLGTGASRVDMKETSHTREPKRQKRLNYGSSDADLQSHAYSQQIVSQSDPAVSDYEENKFKDTPLITSTEAWDEQYVDGGVCAFCHSSEITEGTGRLLHYANGKEVVRGEAAFTKSIPVHSKCIEWTPQVYFTGETIKNLESELARASKLKCSSCGLKGAALGCYAKSCRRSYHVPCAVETPDCRWDFDDFVMLCPIHKSIKFRSEKSNSRKRHGGEKCSSSSQITSEPLNFWATSVNGPQEWVLCGSALSSEDKCLVAKLAIICGATVLKFWSPNVTHVIAATYSDGAYSRTLKVFMAILNGKWILSMDWVRACVEANHPVNEEPYEVSLDNHGFCGAPRTGRLRASKNAPKLFDGLSFYFNGDFNSSYKSDLLDLVRVGGGTIIESMELRVTERHDDEFNSTAFVVYNYDYPQGRLAKEARAADVAKSISAHVIPHTWVLESIAACRVLPCSS